MTTKALKNAHFSNDETIEGLEIISPNQNVSRFLLIQRLKIIFSLEIRN